MSVINQMLRDLDERAASEQERAGLPPRLRPLPSSGTRRTQSWRVLAGGIGIGALAAGGAVAVLMSRTAPPSAVPPAPTFATPAAVPAPVPQAGSIDMKLATQLVQAPPTPATPPAIPPAKPVPPPPRPASTPVQTSPPHEAKPASVAEAAPADAHIDKRPKGGQAREMSEAEYRKGMQAVQRGDMGTARPFLQRALELEPAHVKARQALLSVLVGSRQWPAAQQVAQNGLDLDPAQSGWAIILARLQFEQGDAATAVATLERHAAHASRDADYQSLFAYLLQKQQRPAEAAEHFKAALALRPNEGRWWFGLGTALEAAGNGDGAKLAYTRARETGNLPTEMAAAVEQKLK
jgi:MSHA biogenesis protein MshN